MRSVQKKAGRGKAAQNVKVIMHRKGGATVVVRGKLAKFIDQACEQSGLPPSAVCQLAVLHYMLRHRGNATGDRITVELSESNSRLIRKASELTNIEPERLVNEMALAGIAEDMVDPRSGVIEGMLDGVEYPTAAEAKRIAKTLNAATKACGLPPHIRADGRTLRAIFYRLVPADAAKTA